MKNDEQQRHEARASFYANVAIFVLLNCTLAGISFVYAPSMLWTLFLLLGWGSGLLALVLKPSCQLIWLQHRESDRTKPGPSSRRTRLN
jgi:predicted membrane channel-forming protein YqfA (hemolysin III family)